MWIGASTIEAAGASLRRLPCYSPDLNLIEMAFARLKGLLKQTATRTGESFLEVIADALNAFTSQECTNGLCTAAYGCD